MILLHFAHRGEAQTFISGLGLWAQGLPIQNVYGNSKFTLVISGEGIFDAGEKVTALIAMKPQIKEVINIGICAISDQAVASLNSIYHVRSSYLFEGSSPFFKSYHSAGELDCISCHQRVTTPELAKKLMPLAPLIDRELWAVARAAKLFNKPFKSIKLTSDIAGDTNCLDIKYKAKEYSDKLYEHFLTLGFTDNNPIELEQEIDLGIHLSFQQKIILKKVLNALSLKYEKTYSDILSDSKIEIIKEEKISSKLKFQKIYENLENQLNPIKEIITHKLNEFKEPLKMIGANIHFDPSLEKKEFSITMTINHQTNLLNLKNAVSKLEFENFENIMDGKFDV